jgi:hypothetical protein
MATTKKLSLRTTNQTTRYKWTLNQPEDLNHSYFASSDITLERNGRPRLRVVFQDPYDRYDHLGGSEFSV